MIDLAKLLQIAAQRRNVGPYEVDRVVDLVRDAGGELAERGHLFRLHELGLCSLERVVRGLELVERLLQLDIPEPLDLRLLPRLGHLAACLALVKSLSE